MQGQNATTQNTGSTRSADRSAFSSFFKRTLALFIILFMIVVLSGYAPVGVREMNDAFFSLFITDRSGELPVDPTIQAATESTATPSVSINATSLKNQSTSGKVIGATNDPFPGEIRIPVISVDARINNPESQDIEVLDQSLQSGAVRYPTSGTLQNDRTMLIFGHSSHLPVVHNKNYQVFNRLSELKSGDLIYVRSDKQERVYSVKTVTLVEATVSAIPVGNDRKLYLVSCNNFAGKEARYVAEAELVKSYSLTN